MSSKLGSRPLPGQTPLKDRLFSNAPDQAKSSILRESGHGWTSPPPASDKGTTPLRIPSKISLIASRSDREQLIGKANNVMTPHQSQVTRRTSNSFKNLRSGSLVSKSPFRNDAASTSNAKSAPPLVPRIPVSITRKVSAEKRPRPPPVGKDDQVEPFAYKRERRESKSYNAMKDKEPVSNSPFKADLVASERLLTSPNRELTPSRSNLVSKRMLGPRTGSTSSSPQKKVTFDEECDVLEFEDVTEDGQASIRSSDAHDSADNGELFNDSFDSADIDPNDSIAGMVDSMIQDVRLSRYADEEMEVDETDLPPPVPKKVISSKVTPEFFSESGFASSPPLSRSTHAQRMLTQRERDPVFDEDADLLLPIPSPKKIASSKPQSHSESLIPRFMIAGDKGNIAASAVGKDPFNLPPTDAFEPLLAPSQSLMEISFASSQSSQADRLDYSAADKEASLLQSDSDMFDLPINEVPLVKTRVHNSGVVAEIRSAEQGISMTYLALSPPASSPQVSSPLHKDLKRIDSDSVLVSSPGSGGCGPKINREDVQKRLALLARSGTSSPRPTTLHPNMKRVSGQTDESMENAENHAAERPSSTSHTGISTLGLGLPPGMAQSPARSVGGTCAVFPGTSPGAPLNIDDMNKRSALDRLVDDIKEKGEVNANQSEQCDGANDSFMTDVTEATTEADASPVDTENVSPPPPPPKDTIRAREQAILQQRRAARQAEADETERFAPPIHHKPNRRRSRSTGDVRGAANRTDSLLGVDTIVDGELEASIQQELRKIGGNASRHTYHVKEHNVIYASSDAYRVSHHQAAGNLDVAQAWKPVRRPSDMNEYSKQIKEFRAQEKPGKAHGKVFVRVLAVRSLDLPMPSQETIVTCTLNNGIHFVTTPECRLSKDCKIEQEFELIEHNKLEFTLTLKVKRDPHIDAQFKAIAPPALRPVPTVAPPSRGGVRGFFSSPKKAAAKLPMLPPIVPLPDNLARYMKTDGTLARAFISFKDIASRCDTRLLESAFSLIGQRLEPGGAVVAVPVGEVVLQLFRLPPLPGVKPSEMPQSLDECHRGLRHIKWHKQTYHEGTLTQSGGDCTSWRRRQLRVIGAKLVAFNDVTKKATATIDLKKAIAVEDDQENVANTLNSPSSAMSARTASRFLDDYDGISGVERSFRLVFPEDQEIVFFADTDDDKAKWLQIFRALVGHVPPRPLWAELIWEREEDLRRQAESTTSPGAASGARLKPNSQMQKQ